MEKKILEKIKRIQSIANAGLAYSNLPFDLERYDELKKISYSLLSDLTGAELSLIENLFLNETGYQTPKVDIRGVVFKDNKILMVKEKVDNKWSLPGGWADVGYSPAEVAVKEVWEEAGLKVDTVKLLAVLDKKSHKHPPSPFYVYKIFFLCKETGGSLTAGSETLEVNYFGVDELPVLSETRITKSQIDLLFEFLRNPDKETVFD